MHAYLQRTIGWVLPLAHEALNKTSMEVPDEARAGRGAPTMLLLARGEMDKTRDGRVAAKLGLAAILIAVSWHGHTGRTLPCGNSRAGCSCPLETVVYLGRSIR
jgi:hypothetical protein